MKLADAALGFSLLASFGLFLVYVFQMGVFSLLGFEYAGLMGALDLWPNVERLLPFAIGMTLISLTIVILLQWLEQSKVSATSRISNNSLWIHSYQGQLL